jgi:hypothetical protein
VDRAEAGHSQHGDDGLGDHRHVDRHAVALADAEAGEHVRRPLHLAGELGVGDAAAVARLALPVDRHAVADASRDVAVEAVLGHVEAAIAEPARERRVRPVEGLGEGGLPVQLAGPVCPEGESVGTRLRVDPGLRHRGGRELGARREAPVFVQEAVDRGRGHRHPWSM